MTSLAAMSPKFLGYGTMSKIGMCGPGRRHGETSAAAAAELRDIISVDARQGCPYIDGHGTALPPRFDGRPQYVAITAKSYHYGHRA